MEGVPYRSTMNKKIDKAALASRILALEGISSEDKSALLELLSEQKRYGLVWEDSPEEVEALLREKLPVLTEDTTKRILADTADEVPNHILIEGDNYPALVALQYAYEGKVDVIYIDPPYNTGNKDFVYNDSYVDSEDSYRHSKWLSFMSKRLRIAKRLLSDRGVIFISIDDNEQANLKLLCDEVFGRKNFVASIIWRGGRRNMAKWISTSHEYMLLYANDIEYCSTIKVEWNERKKGLNEIYKAAKDFCKQTSNDYYKASSLLKDWFKKLSEDNPCKDHEHYCWIDENGVYFASDISRGGGGGPKWEIKNPYTGQIVKTPQRGWAYSTLDDLLQDIKKGFVHFNGDGVPCKKRYLKDNETQIMETVFYKDRRGSSKRLRDLMGYDAFPFPKDEEIIKEKLKSFSTEKSLILDFFAGSGTTLHATMQLNAEDGGNRRCILVTNNENNICEEVTYERNKRVIKGYTTPKGQQVEGLKNNNLRYYKVDFVDREKTAANQTELMKASTDLLCIKENLYQEETCFEGLKLHPQIARYFTDGVIGGSQMLVLYEPNAIPVIVKRIEQMTVVESNPIKVYVMAEGQYPYTEDFESVLSKIELRAMPHALYQAMRQVLPPPAEAENTEQEMEVSDEEADGSIYKSEEL